MLHTKTLYSYNDVMIEPVFVICRKNEYKTYNANKQVKSISSTGQKYYENVYNFIENEK